METYSEHTTEGNSEIERDLEHSHGNTLSVKIAELIKAKEQLKQAKDSTMQSWLDSKPLIDELERLKSSLTAAENRRAKSVTVIKELESQLEIINKSIRSKKEEELRATEMINERNQALDQIRGEMERMKRDEKDERHLKIKSKQTLRIKKHTLRSLQLALRAVQMETEAYSASAAEALRYIKCSEMENTNVHLAQEDYRALSKRAEDENSLAAWRISVSMEQKLAAEASRDIALTKLKELQSGKRWRGRELNKGTEIGRQEEKGTSTRVEMETQNDNTREVTSPKIPAKSTAQSSQAKPRPKKRRSKGNKNKKMVARKKLSIFSKIRLCLVRNVRKFMK